MILNKWECESRVVTTPVDFFYLYHFYYIFPLLSHDQCPKYIDKIFQYLLIQNVNCWIILLTKGCFAFRIRCLPLWVFSGSTVVFRRFFSYSNVPFAWSQWRRLLRNVATGQLGQNFNTRKICFQFKPGTFKSCVHLIDRYNGLNLFYLHILYKCSIWKHEVPVHFIQ